LYTVKVNLTLNIWISHDGTTWVCIRLDSRPQVYGIESEHQPHLWEISFFNKYFSLIIPFLWGVAPKQCVPGVTSTYRLNKAHTYSLTIIIFLQLPWRDRVSPSRCKEASCRRTKEKSKGQVRGEYLWSWLHTLWSAKTKGTTTTISWKATGERLWVKPKLSSIFHQQSGHWMHNMNYISSHHY